MIFVDLCAFVDMCTICVLYARFGSSVTPKKMCVCSWVVLYICTCSLVLYSAGSGVNSV